MSRNRSSGSDPREPVTYEEPTTALDRRILLLCEPGRDRELIEELLERDHHIVRKADLTALDSDVDLCIVDETLFDRNLDAFERWKAVESPTYAPILLLTAGINPGDERAVWQVADDVVETPVSKVGFRARVENLLDRRRTATALEDSRAELAETVDELRVKERAMDAAPIGITISDPQAPDNPLIYANEAFVRITGYTRAEILGQNSRFLQGSGTADEPVETMAAAIDEERAASVDLLNYRKDGTKFWNHVEIAPVHAGDEVVNYVGFQSDITEQKIREQRLVVLNRLLTHNLRNRLNVIHGYASLLESELAEADLIDYARTIQQATERLSRLSNSVRQIADWIESADFGHAIGSAESVVDVERTLHEAVAVGRELDPDATITLDIPEGEWWTRCEGLSIAVDEAVENAIRHNEAEDRVVQLSVAPAENDWLEIAVEDNGPGIPAHESAVIQSEIETALHHSEGVGLWLMYWILESAGGEVSFPDPDCGVETPVLGGGRVVFSLPRADGPTTEVD